MNSIPEGNLTSPVPVKTQADLDRINARYVQAQRLLARLKEEWEQCLFAMYPDKEHRAY
jgi:hypothetical protein